MVTRRGRDVSSPASSHARASAASELIGEVVSEGVVKRTNGEAPLELVDRVGNNVALILGERGK